MAKSSKSCGYTGHMRVMNRENVAKNDFQSGQAKSHGFNTGAPAAHAHHKVEYPEVQAEARAEKKCTCKK